MSFEATHPLHLMREAITPATDATRRHQTPSDANHTRQQTDAIRRITFHSAVSSGGIRRHQASSGVIRRHHLPLGRVGLKQTNHQPTALWPYVPDEGDQHASSGVTRRHQAPSGAIRRHQASSEAISARARGWILDHRPISSGAIRRHQASSGVIRRHQSLSGVIRRHQRTCTRMDPRPQASRAQRLPSAP